MPIPFSYGFMPEPSFPAPQPPLAGPAPAAPGGFLGGLANRLPTYGMDLDDEARKRALYAGLLSFGSNLIGQRDLSALGPAVQAGFGAHRQTLGDYDAARRQREYDEQNEAHRRAQMESTEALAAERQRKAREAEMAAVDEREAEAAMLARHDRMLETIPEKDRPFLETLRGTSRFDIEAGMLYRGDKGEEAPYSVSDQWIRQPDGSELLFRRDPQTGDYKPVPGAPKRHPAPRTPPSESRITPYQEAGIIQRFDAQLQKELAEVKDQLDKHYIYRDDETHPYRLPPGQVARLQQRQRTLQDPRLRRQLAQTMAREEIAELGGGSAAGGQVVPQKILDALTESEKSNPETMTAIRAAIAAGKTVEEILATIQSVRGR